jgi:hypothetical protein
MDIGNGDRGELLRPGGILSVLAGVCLALAGAVLALVIASTLGLWQSQLPYLATLEALLPLGVGHTLLVAAIVMLTVGIVAFIGGVLVVKGNGDTGGLSMLGGLLSVFAGVCLGLLGAMFILVVVYETGLWQPALPYLDRLGGFLPVEAGNRLLIGAAVVLALGVLIIMGGASAVRRAGVAVESDAEGLTYVGPERPVSTVSTAGRPHAAVAAAAPIPAGTRVGVGTDAAPAAPTGIVEPAPVDDAAVEPVARKSRVELGSLDEARLGRAKAGFCTRRVPKEDMRTLVTGDVRPRAGDIVLARVERIRQHKRIELVTGRKARLEPGDEVILACGNRYAADQFEGFVPESLGPAHLIAAGGVAAVEAKRARRMRPATTITLLGLVADVSGIPLNLASYALPTPEVEGTRPPVIAVFGTSMNSGKTTAVCFLCRGLTAAGFTVGYAKLTGTGAGNDYWRVLDSGACAVVDFTDAGLVSTYRTPISVLELTSVNLIGHLVSRGCDRIVVEIADGLLQGETNGLIRSNTFHELVDRVVFTAGDAISAIGGVRVLKEHGFDVACVSGLLTASPLPFREASAACGVPVLSNDDLGNAETAARLFDHDPTTLETMGKPAHREVEGDDGEPPAQDEWSDSLEDQE